ncbi:MAG: hypothetical protein KGQ36_02515 [Rickettsiales bacterium]|nr:hypothetical protein [Rickettsiales bacterium]
MNYIILQKLKENKDRAVKCLSVFFAVFLFLTIIFYSSKSSSNPLPNCSNLDNATTAVPGVNCLYLDLPICTSTSEATSTVANPNPRVNCADVIDLPLCADFADGPTAPKELKNCVKKCSDIASGSGVRGVDYAVHNRDCVRFCSDDPALEDLSSLEYRALADSQKCVASRCHQISEGDLGTHNCNLLSCKLLTIDELNETKFADATKKYCDGEADKCYDFSQDKLQYLIPGVMCKLHNCSPQPQPASALCSDYANIIINKPTQAGSSNSFLYDYIQYIVQPKNADGSVQIPAALSPPDNTTVKDQLLQSCIPSDQTCLPLQNRSYGCTPATTGEDPPTKPDANCDTSCDVSGYCTKKIDCNNPSSASEPECLPPNHNDEDDVELDPNDDSWFYNPSPMDKSVDSSGLLLSHMNNSLCYDKSDMKDNHWGVEARYTILGVTIDLGYFHSEFQPDRSRSPGMCGVPRSAGRGTGYIYLCGNEGVLNKKVSDYTAYHSNKSTTTFTNTDSTTQVKVCLRFKNAFRPMDTVSNSETCGKRECAISCAFGLCESQLCGEDVCQTLTVKESKATDCIMNDDMFTSANGGRDCASIVDDYLRVRAVQYGNKVCTFLDVKGQLAYYDMFMSGKERLSDGTCLAETNSNGECDGKDSSDRKGEATLWRAMMRIPYISNNRNTDPRGYVKKDGTLIKEQECIKIPLRVRTPRLYNVATQENAFKLFTPPLYISKSYATDGSSSTLDSGTLGPTDFNYPKIEVTYGDRTTQVLSLDINKTGYETGNDKDPNASKDPLTTTFNGYDYQTKVAIKKDFNSETSTPTLCLYQTFTDSNGTPQEIKISCIDRSFPEINNDRFGTPTRKVIIAAPATNTYDSAKISLKYQGPNATNLSSEILLGNATQSIPECKSDVENYKICAQREECNMLNNEFVTNEINIQNNTPPEGQDMNSMLAMRDYYNSTLIPACDQKSGKIGDYTASNAYGWFDEICISSGFETKLKDIVAYKVFDGSNKEVPSITGKCVIDTVHSLNGGIGCTKGGKAPDCICLDANGVVLDPNNADDARKIIRKQTLREAGLCVDLPIPNKCFPITYNSDAARTAGTNTGNADFATYAFGGMNNVIGQCEGNWKNAQINGVDVPPMMNCVRNADNTVSWSYAVTNPCVRYSCPAITTQPRINSGVVSYTNSYTTATENTDDIQGQSNGYATWNSQTSDDTMQNISAATCITGFAQNGTSPTRGCSSQGMWQNVTNACVRKTCPPLNFVSSAAYDSEDWNRDWNASPNNPANAANDTQEYNIWYNWDQYGGASFKVTNASRVVLSSPNYEAAVGSIATGTCNQHLGYFPLGDGPTMKCDQNGNWVDLKNRCVTSCDAVVNGGSNDGNASWNAATVPNDQQYTIVSATSCNAGYKAYPYSAPQDVDGNYINSTTDPNDPTKKLYVDATPLLAPRRKCQNSDIVIGNTIVKAAVWKDPYPACINKCPGAATDSRVGVGVTKHKLSNNSFVYLEWSDANPGESQIIYSSTPQNVADYSPNHSAGVYAVKRTCGPDYKWKTYNVGGVTEYVKPQCSSRSGNIINTNTISSSPTDTINENVALTTVACISGYGSKTTPPQFPQFTCQANGNRFRYIDQFYYNKTGGRDCVKTCDLPSNGHTFGNGSQYNGGASGTKFEGDTITLACRSGYGKKIDSNYSTFDNTCGINALDRTNVSPTTTCLNTGEWSNSVTNDCDICRSCTSSNLIYLNPDNLRTSYKRGMDGCYMYRTLDVSLGSSDLGWSLSHDNNYTVTLHDDESVDNGVSGLANCHHDWNMDGYFTFTCKDSKKVLTRSTCGGSCP